MKKIGIIGAMAQEIRIIKDSLIVSSTDNFSGFTFITGSLNGKWIVLTVSGVGKVNAAICAQVMIDKFNVDCIINNGFAGTMHPEVRVCDVIISESVTYHDVRKEQMAECFPYLTEFQSDSRLINYAIHACDIIRSDNWHYRVGKIVSGDSFVTDPRLRKRIMKEYSPMCMDMEGAAIGHVAAINRIPFVVIRCIADGTDIYSTIDQGTFGKISANIAAGIVVNMIKLLSEYNQL